VAALPAWNWIANPTRVLPLDLETEIPERSGNIRHLKVAYAIAEAPRFDSFIFGSSRIRYGISLDRLGDNWFKLDFPGARPSEMFPVLDAFDNRGIVVRNLWIGLDDFALYDDRDEVRDAWLRPHPAQWSDWPAHYIFYLFRRPSHSDLDLLSRWWAGRPIQKQTDRIKGERSGIAIPPRKRAEARGTFVVSRASRSDLTERTPRMTELLEVIRRLIERCEQSGIDLTVFTTPRHYKTLLMRNRDEIDQFKRELAGITSFYDFAFLSLISGGERYWHDPSHFSPLAGNLVIRTIQGENTVAGIHVTQDNIEAHLRTQQKGLIDSIPNLFKSNPSLQIHSSLLDSSSGASVGPLLELLAATNGIIQTPGSTGQEVYFRLEREKGRLEFDLPPAARDALDPTTLVELTLSAAQSGGGIRIGWRGQRIAEKQSVPVQPGTNTLLLETPRGGPQEASLVILLRGQGNYQIHQIRLLRLRATHATDQTSRAEQTSPLSSTEH